MQNNPLVNRAIRFLSENYQDDITLDALSQHLRCSKFYLVKTFRQHLNITPMRWLMRFRLAKAANRLQNQEPVSLVNLALDSGFKNQSHFSTSFKKHKGLSPSEYQRQTSFELIVEDYADDCLLASAHRPTSEQ